VHSYGMEFTPGDRWSFAATFENGQISDPLTGTFDRTAATGTVGYSGGGIRFASAIEARFEDGPGRKQESWLTRNTLGIEVNPSWRLLGRLNVAISDADQSSILDAGFVEGVVGAAYRPIENNRLNMLFKYTYLKDTSTFGQLSGSGTSAAPKQRNQVLSIDANYKLAKWLTIGGKYGYRFGEVALSRDSNVFLKSGVQLAVLRGDIHVVNKWDFTAEGRYFKTSQAKDQRFGAVVGIYREIADNARFGVGYSFSDYSDDLTNVEAKSRGWFLNMIGKY
jgi:lipopolysaccharide assembly outer membrane protein LptD (OstA)